MLFNIYTTISQTKQVNKLIFTSFDRIIGMNNTNLSYGVVFTEKYRRKLANNHNYFKHDFFTKSTIVYQGEHFYDIDLKYDIVDDILIIKIKNDHSQISISPEKNLISEFKLDNHTFVNSYKKNIGYLELLTLSDEFSILKKHHKTSTENRDRRFIYHTFKKKNEQYYLYYDGKYSSIKTDRDFIKIFPNNKKEIIQFFKENRFLLKNDFAKFATKLTKQLLA
ncbi:hypothetical protein C8N26_1946 [Tenacibaculum lutimaris]|uniref:Uncharacterized protein n=2 Tax=Tenacibaculum lutimaris TaxID=285258 RepID=A0A420E0X2_9FLAO|nr:hypothetical protein C8N26_1946 [Tenacibaculum lutimaris]